MAVKEVEIVDAKAYMTRVHAEHSQRAQIFINRLATAIAAGTTACISVPCQASDNGCEAAATAALAAKGWNLRRQSHSDCRDPLDSTPDTWEITPKDPVDKLNHDAVVTPSPPERTWRSPRQRSRGHRY